METNLKAGMVPKKPFSDLVNSKGMQAAITNTLQDAARAKRFTASIITAVSNNKQLKECDSVSIISAALLGESLNLSPSPQLGHYYLVPFNDTKSGQKIAQFQIGYKGYIQLAIRSGQYKKLNALSIKEGELVKFDPLNEEITVNLIENEEEREKTKTVGYYVFFECINGFRKAMYWSKEKMESHALRYSKAYRAKKGGTIWETDFDSMALKTMLRQLISKWGIMSIQMNDALDNDETMNEIKDGKISKVEEPIEVSVNEIIDESPEAIVEKVDFDEL